MKKYTVWIVLGVMVIFGLILVGKFIGWKNRLVTLDENTKSAWSQIETQLQRRVDLIPNLVSTVKGYAAHEEEVLTEVTKARASVAGAGTVDQKIASNNQLTSALSRLMVVVEKYPDLKANQNFLALQDELAGTENRIAVTRQRYNEAAKLLNTAIRKFPYTLVAGGFKASPYYEADAGAKEAPKVSFEK
jgi:LemA protein